MIICCSIARGEVMPGQNYNGIVALVLIQFAIATKKCRIPPYPPHKTPI